MFEAVVRLSAAWGAGRLGSFRKPPTRAPAASVRRRVAASAAAEAVAATATAAAAVGGAFCLPGLGFNNAEGATVPILSLGEAWCDGSDGGSDPDLAAAGPQRATGSKRRRMRANQAKGVNKP